MTLDVLIHQYMEEKDYKPSCASDLLVFLKRGYIQGKLTFIEYRKLIQELEQQGATTA